MPVDRVGVLNDVPVPWTKVDVGEEYQLTEAVLLALNVADLVLHIILSAKRVVLVGVVIVLHVLKAAMYPSTAVPTKFVWKAPEVAIPLVLPKGLVVVKVVPQR